jgi:hypothetical protein
MKYQFLFVLFFPFLFSAQKKELFHNEKATFEYHKSIEKSLGIGVLGMQTKKAFVIFIDEKSIKNSPVIFNKVQFESINFNGKKSVAFLCIYENNKGLPGNIINKAKISVPIPPKKTEIIADLSQLKISVPKNGYFIGFEWILTKENLINGVKNPTEKPYNPTIVGIQNDKLNLFSLNKNWQKEESQLVNSLNINISYLPKN